MDPATPVISPIQQAVPAVPGSPASMPVVPVSSPVAAAPAPAPATAPGALGATFPQSPPTQTPVGGSPGTPAAPAPAGAPAVTDIRQHPEFLALQAERNRVNQELARIQPWAAIGWRTQQAGQPGTAGAVPPVAPAPATTPTRVGVPPLDPSVSMFLVEQNGQIVEAPGAPPGTFAAYQKHQRDTAAYIRSLAEDPTKALSPVIEQIRKEALEEAKKQFAGETKAQQDQVHARRIMSENSSWMYERDAQGNVLGDFDPLSMQQSPRVTEAGQVWQQTVRGLINAGMTDPVEINENAKARVHLWAWQKQEALKAAAAQQQPAPPPPGQTVNLFGIPTIVPTTGPVATPTPNLQVPGTDPRLQFLAKVPGALPGQYNPPPTNGMSPPAAPPRRSVNPLQEWKAEAMQAMLAAGYNENSRLPVGGTG